MNKTQRVVLKKQNETSAGLCEADSHGLSKIACSSRRTRMGTAVFLALAPVSLMVVPQVSSAVLVDNLAKVSNERARVYSSQVREALSAVAPRVSGVGSEGAGRLGAVALSGSGLTPDQLIVSGAIDGTTPTTAVGTNAVAIGVNAHAAGDYSVAVGSYTSATASSAAVGMGVSSTGNESTALGVRTSAYSDHGLAMGWRTSVDTDATDSLAIGSATQVYAAGAGGIGKDNVVGGAGTYAVGNGNVAFGADSFVLGSNVTARGKNSVVLGANSDGSLNNVVSVGDVGSERRIVHVAAAVSATDAVNMSQIKALGATTNALGTMTNAFVAYDGVDKSVITLGAASPGTPGSTPAPAVTLTNLKAAALSAQSSDAVNGAQLNATNTNVQDVATSLATLTRAEPLKLAYTDDSKSNVVLGGTGGTILSNLKAGVADQDAVNVAQLKNAGLIDSTGNTLAAITYDTKADGTTNRSSVTLGGVGATAPVALHNVAAGDVKAGSTDAVNGDQLFQTAQLVDSLQNGAALKYFNSNTTLAAAKANGLDATAIGGNAQATADNTVALGANSVADRADSVSVGAAGNERQITNVKAGTADHDAVSVAQFKDAGLIDSTGNTIAAITYDSKADGSVNRSSVTLGGSGAASPVALHNVAAGVVKAGSTDAVNGDQLFQTAQLVDGLQNGAALKYLVSNTTLAAASASGLNATAIGGNAQAIAGNTVAVGANSVADRLNSVSVGAAGNERQITNVQAGTADTDAVNVGQMKSAGLVDQTGKAVTALAYDKDASGATDFGNVTLGQGIAGGTAIHNVAAGTLATDAVNVGQLNDIVTHVSNFVTSSSALYSAAGDTSTEAATASGTHAVAMGANATASAANSVALGAGSVADRASSVSVGAVGSERQITNVAAGTLATDAVNLSQLNQSASSTLSQANSYTDQRFNNTDQQIRDLDRNTRKGIASASALNVVTPYLPGRTTLNAGIAAYRGQAAMGIGVSRWNDKGNINFNGGVSSSGGNSTIVRAGVGYVFGG
ncbi:Coiled stalk of trimeric autotransporter adhesin [Caballeronia sp. SBC1]|uniref:YadA-like family protein n=1 Tax=Caballeronia sp. SBC1 TaxID=2705548 RepID=UPI001407B3DC|nr:YadA-like family protein [Caballeronia sp. SBC1]QIN62114.1 Coiled stalk of trimeric autotransporter adhesin [Caballeronia sp. SBC1]